MTVGRENVRERVTWTAIGLLIGYESPPFGAAAGIGLALPMTGALFFSLRVHDSAGYLLADATLLGLATVTAVLRIS